MGTGVLRGLCGVTEEIWVVGRGQQSWSRDVPGKTHNPGGKAVGNPTVRWVQELWEFRLRRKKGSHGDPAVGRCPASAWTQFLEGTKVGHLPHVHHVK